MRQNLLETVELIRDRAMMFYTAAGIMVDPEQVAGVVDMAAHRHHLDLDRLLSFDDGNFMHDVGGILAHFDPYKNELTGFFFPRCGTKK